MKFDFIKKHRKLFVGILILFVVFSATFAPQTAPQVHADTTPPTGPQVSTLGCIFGIFLNTGCEAGTVVAGPVSTVASIISCAFGGGNCTGVIELILIPLHFTSWLFGIAGLLFDSAITYTIVDISANINVLAGINSAWAVIRDLINFSFIFILLYAAIQMILNGGGNMKKVIPTIVIAAILINFSLFFAKVIVDTSNIVTLQVYDSIIASCDPTHVSDLEHADLSGCFAGKLGVASLFQITSASGTDNAQSANLLSQLTNNFSLAAIISIGGSIFLLIATFVFLAAGIMLLIRFVIIVILFIFSPLMVIGGVLPGIGKQTNKWWGEMTDQAIFPAVFMLMIWIILKIISGAAFLGIGGSTATATTIVQGTTNINVVANYVIIIGFLVATLIISKSFSKHGGKLGTEWAGKIMGGGGGYIGRRTLGSASRSIADSDTLRQKASEKGFVGSMARLTLRGGQRGAKASYDLRGGVTSTLGKELGAGKAQGKGGYDEYIKGKAKVHEDFVKTLGPTDVVVDAAKQDRKKAEDELKDARKAREDARINGDTVGIAAAEDRMTEARKKIGATDQILGLGDKDIKARQDAIDKERTARESEIDTARGLEGLQKQKTAIDTEIKQKREDLQKEIELKEKDLKAAILDESKKKIQEEIDQKKAAAEKEITDLQDSLKVVMSEIQVVTDEKTQLKTIYEGEKNGIKKVTGLADKRKEGYIETLTGGPYNEDFMYGTDNRVLGIGMVKRQNAVAIANMRKGGKSIEDTLKDLVKEQSGDKPKEEEKAPEGGAPAGGSPAGGSGGSPKP